MYKNEAFSKKFQKSSVLVQTIVFKMSSSKSVETYALNSLSRVNSVFDVFREK